MSKKLPNFCSDGYFEFWPQNQYKGVKIYSPDLLFFFFFLVDQFPTYGQSSNFWHWTGGGYSMCLHHEGSMIGVQCHWWFVEDILEHLRVHFKFFLWLTVLWQIDILVQFCTLVFISSRIWKGRKWVRRSKILSGLNLNMVQWDPVQKQEKFLSEAHRSEKRCTFLGPKHKSAIWDRTPPTYTSNLVYMCAGGFRGHESLNRIELSWFVQELL